MINYFSNLDSKDLYSDDCADTLVVKKGEFTSLLIPNSTVGCGNKIKLIKCTKDENCESIEIETNLGCLAEPFGANMSFFTFTLEDVDTIEPFYINIGDTELVQFEGGTQEEMFDNFESYNILIESTKYGYRLYFDKEFSGETITTNATSISINEQVACFKKSNFKNISFTICELGCFRIVVYTDKKDYAISGNIKVIEDNKKYSLLQYYDEGFLLRYRIEANLFGNTFDIKEEEKTLSNGQIAITGVTINEMSTLYVSHYTTDQHRELLRVLKNGAYLNNEKVLLKGAYAIGEQDFDNLYSATAQVVLSDKYSSNSSCDTTCTSLSTATIEIVE